MSSESPMSGGGRVVAGRDQLLNPLGGPDASFFLEGAVLQPRWRGSDVLGLRVAGRWAARRRGERGDLLTLTPKKIDKDEVRRIP